MEEIIEILPPENKTKNLATVQVIKCLEPIEKADKIELAKFEDICYASVVKKGEFKVGQKVIYIQVDTILPDGAAWSAFLKDKNLPGEPIRLKTVKLRGALSQGLVLPLAVIPAYSEYEHDGVLQTVFVGHEHGQEYETQVDQGDDVTERIGVKKYEKPIPSCLAGMMKGNFPGFLRKTDEERLQNWPRVIEEILVKDIYISLKCDGTSGTYYLKDGVFGACSRNMDLIETEGNTYWKVARDLDLENKLKDKGEYSIQGEICGPGVQGNKIGLTEIQFFAFNVFDIKEQKFLSFEEFCTFCNDLKILHVPILYTGKLGEQFDTVDKFIHFANQQLYPNNAAAEGIVVRPLVEMKSEFLGSRLSFKVISNVFALKHGE